MVQAHDGLRFAAAAEEAVWLLGRRRRLIRRRHDFGLIELVVTRRKVHRYRRFIVADFVRAMDIDVGADSRDMDADDDGRSNRPAL